MAILYRIKPTDKNSVEAFYDVYKRMPDGGIKGWNVTETYRSGQGFVEDEGDLPCKEDKSIRVNPGVGWGADLGDRCAVNFEFDESFTDDEKAEIEKFWYEGDPADEDGRSGAAWLCDWENGWVVEDECIKVLGPFHVDKIDEDQYDSVLEEGIELRSKFVGRKRGG